MLKVTATNRITQFMGESYPMAESHVVKWILENIKQESKYFLLRVNELLNIYKDGKLTTISF